jgi:hypothetical protein
MSQIIDLCRDSDGDGERPNTASVPSLQLSRKRPRDKEESSNDALPRNENGPGNKTATGSEKFVVELELADEVKVASPYRKRRGVPKSKASGKNDATGKCAQILEGLRTTENDVGNEDAQVADRRESHEGIAADASYPMNSDSEQASRDDGSANNSKPPSKASGRQWRVSAWEDRLSELADYRNIHGHCNVPKNYNENTKLAKWVTTQRYQYGLHLEGKASHMTTFRIQELESLGFEWGVGVAAWEDRLSELADYSKIHGHCNVPKNYNENTKLAKWVTAQRYQYRLHLEGKASYMTTFRIQELVSLGFEWDGYGAAWEDRLSELADYRRNYGHCNVPRNYSENTRLANWVTRQRSNYWLHLEGKTSSMTTFRIQELERLDFEWKPTISTRKGAPKNGAAWGDRLSELTDYRKFHGHCNVPRGYSENAKLAHWVNSQRKQYKLNAEGKTSQMTPFRIQELESLDFEWTRGRRKGIKKPSLDDDAMCVLERAMESPEHMQQHSLKKISDPGQLGRPSERACRLSQNPGALPCS